MDDQQRKNKLYHNWIKGALGLKILKRGIQKVVEDAINKHHADFLQDISRQLGQPNATCNQCVTQNVLPCDKNCKRINTVCQTHNQPNLMPRPCPNNVCSTLYTKIKDQHRFKSPCWKNTDASLWCTTPWEIAKCYAGDGYADKPTAEEMDCSSILSIIINAQFMQTVMTALIEPKSKSDMFCKNRENRNAIMHSGTFELTKHQLVGYLDDMISLLNDAKTLQNHPDAMTARTKLNDLKDESYSILTKDELDIHEEAMNALEGKKEEALKKIDETIDNALNKIDTRYQNIESKFSDKEKELHDCLLNVVDKHKQKLNEATDSGCETIQKRMCDAERILDDKLKVFQQTLDKDIQQKQSDMQYSLYQTIEQIQKVLQTCQKDMELLKDDLQMNKTKHEDQIDYLKRKQKLQQSLRSMYKRHKATIPISPLMRHITADISDVYTKLVIRDDLINDKRRLDEDQYQGQGQSKQEQTKVESLNEIFDKNGNCCRKIYVIGDAGMGKTTWSINLVNTWVTALEKKEANLEMLECDEKVLLRFDFIFYIALRHSNDDEDIKSMIKSQLFKRQNDLNDITLEILEKESNKCLVILDGLDEFSISVAGIDNTGLPLRDDTYEWTIITTSRMWKMEQLNLPPTETDRAVVIEGLDKVDVVPLTEKLIERLNNNTNTSKNAHKFMEETKFYLPNFMTVPLMLTALVCLWHSGGYAGGSMADVYAGLLVILIKYAEGDAINQRHKNSKLAAISNMKEIKTNWNQSEVWLPEILRSHKKMIEYGPLILKLGKLAFYGLFSSDRKTSLVFTKEAIDAYLSTEELEVALNIGILTKTEVVGNVLEKEFKLAFLHKTLQEYLASVHTSGQTECTDSKTVDLIIKYFNSTANVFEMENVLLFLSGLHPSSAGRLSEHISINIAKFEFLQREFIENSRQLKLYNLLLKCYNQVGFKCRNKSCEIYIKHHRFNIPQVIFRDDEVDNDTAMKYIELNKHLDMSLIVDFNKLTGSDTNKLVQCCIYIQALNLHNVQDENFRELLKNVRNNAQLKSLTVYNSDYPATTAKNLGEVDLTNNTLLQCLELVNLFSDKIILPENDCLVSLILIGVTIRNGINGLQNHGQLEKLILYDIMGDLKHIDLTKNTVLSTLTVKLLLEDNTEESVDECDQSVDIAKYTGYLHTHRLCLDILEMSSDIRYIDLSQNTDLTSVTLQNMSLERLTLPKQQVVETVLLSKVIVKVGHIDLTQSITLKTLTLIQMSVDNVKLPEQRLIENICFKNITLTYELHSRIFDRCLKSLKLDNVNVHYGQHCSEHGQTLKAVEMQTGWFGQTDFTQSKELKKLNLQNMSVERIVLPEHGCCTYIKLTHINLKDCICGIQLQTDLEKLEMDSITGNTAHIDLTKLRDLEELTLQNMSVETIALPHKGCVDTIILSKIKLTDTIHGIQLQEDLKILEMDTITGQIGTIELTECGKLGDLTLQNMSVETIALPHKGSVETIKLSKLKLTDTIHGLQLQEDLEKLEMDTITGHIGTIELTDCKQLEDLTLQNISVEIISLPHQGCVETIYLSNIKLTDTIHGIQLQEDLETLEMDTITGEIGTIELTECGKLGDLTLQNMSVETIALPHKGCVESIKLSKLKLTDTIHSIRLQTDLEKLEMDSITGHIGHIDLTKLGKLEELTLQNMSVETIALPNEGCVDTIILSKIKLTDTIHGIQLQEDLKILEMDTITGQIGHIDLTKLGKLEDLTLQNMSVETIALPNEGSVETIKLSNLVKLEIDSITGHIGHIDLSQSIYLQNLKLKDIGIDRLTLPTNGFVETLNIECLLLQDGIDGIQNPQIEDINMDNIKGDIGHIDLEQNTSLHNLSLKNVSVDRITLPEQSSVVSIMLSNIILTNGLYGLQHPQTISKLQMDTIVGQLGPIDLSLNSSLKHLNLRNISTERLMLPEYWWVEDLELSDVKGDIQSFEKQQMFGKL